MDDKQDRTGGDLAKGDVSLILFVVGSVSHGQAVRIIENELGGQKIESVFGEIFPALLLVVLKSHFSTIIE
jgi:uncharacterized protein YwbE